MFSSLDSKQIALRVSSMILTGGDEVPVVNVWPHITVVCDKVRPLILLLFCSNETVFVWYSHATVQGQAWLSNKLPEMLEEGKATVTPIDPPVTLSCVISGEAKSAP